MGFIRFIAQIWLHTALPSLSLAATCTTSSGEDPSCHADSFLQVGLMMSHDKTRSTINSSDVSRLASNVTKKGGAAVTTLPQSHKEQRTILAQGLMTDSPAVSYLSLDATSEVGMAITAAVRSNLEEYGGRPRLTSQISQDELGDRVVPFPAAITLVLVIHYAIFLAHEVHVGCFGGWPLLQNRVPQTSIGIQVIALWNWMATLMTTAINIPLSLDYTIAMGMDPVLSGVFLSVGCFTGLVGVIVGRIIFDDSKWSQRGLRRCMIVFPEAAAIMGLVTFYLMQWIATKPIGVRRTYWWTCLGVQQISILLQSSVAIPIASVWNKCTPNRDKTFWTMLQQSTKMLGMAMGPGVAGFVIYAVQGDGERVSPVSMQAWMNVTIMGLNLVSSFFTMMYMPVEIPPYDESILDTPCTPPLSHPTPRSPRHHRAPNGERAVESAPPQKQAKPLEPGPEEFDDESREKLVWYTLQFALERPLTVAAVEVATVMILEVQYGWPRESTGIVFFVIAILGTFFSFAVAVLIRTRQIRETYLVFTSGVISAGASLLLFDFGFGGRSGMWTLLLADPLLFTLALTSWGVCEGWAARAVKPGKWWCIEAFRMWDGLLMNLGRTVAPIVARFMIDMGGRNWYAAMQVLVVGLGFHSLRKIVSLFWTYEKMKEAEKGKQLKVSDEPQKQALPQADSESEEAAPETAKDH